MAGGAGSGIVRLSGSTRLRCLLGLHGERVPSESAPPRGFILLTNDADEVYNVALEAIAAAGTTAAGASTSCSSWSGCTSKKGQNRCCCCCHCVLFTSKRRLFLFISAFSKSYVTSASCDKRID